VILAALLGLLLPGAVLGAARTAAARTWIVTLRPELARGREVGQGPEGTPGRPSGATVLARARATSRAIEGLEAAFGFESAFSYRYATSGFAATLTDGQVAALRRAPGVVSVVPDRPVRPALDVVPTSLERVHAKVDTSATEVPIDVAIIDTGIGPPGDPTQQGELNVRGGTNCSRDGQSQTAFGDYWFIPHGTHVAGTIGARHNDRGVVGVAPGARLWAVRVFDRFGVGSTATVMCGVDWAARWQATHPNRRLVANMSLSGFDFDHSPDRCDAAASVKAPDPLHLAICGAVEEQRVVIVAAAGNDRIDTDQSVPARYPQVIAVSAISDFDGRPGQLSRQEDVSGCQPPAGRERDDAFSRYSNFGADVDIGAPGTCVLSVRRGGTRPGATLLMSGTSMAAPHVTGAVARYLARPGNQTVAPERIRRLLIATGSLDWTIATDPDHHPDRLLDIEALLATSPGLALWPTRSELAANGSADLELSTQLQRLGGYAGRVVVSFDELPAGVSSGAPATLDGLMGLSAMLQLRVHPTALEGDHTLTIRASAEGGLVSTTSELTLRIDRTPPVIGASSPRARLVARGAYRGSAPVRLAWTATDPGGHVARTDLQQRQASGAWRRIRSAGAHGQADVTLTGSRRGAFRVRATDDVGNVGQSQTLVTWVQRRDSSSEQIVWSGSWRTRSSSVAAGRSLRASSSPGASAELSFTGRAVAWVAPTGPGEGRARVLIDDVAVATINLQSSSSRSRRIVFASPALTPGQHRITIRVLKGRVELDALLVLR
jgi:subtilisin family serine protease